MCLADKQVAERGIRISEIGQGGVFCQVRLAEGYLPSKMS